MTTSDLKRPPDIPRWSDLTNQCRQTLDYSITVLKCHNSTKMSELADDFITFSFLLKSSKLHQFPKNAKNEKKN